MRPRYLVDKSALSRMPIAAVRRRLAPILETRQAATCSIIDLEVLYSARSADEHHRILHRRSLAYHRVPLTEAIFRRAIEVQGRLALTGRHRIPIADLIIAATAESARLVVLHYDADFDRIAEMTSQRVEWVVPRGSV